MNKTEKSATTADCSCNKGGCRCNPCTCKTCNC